MEPSYSWQAAIGSQTYYTLASEPPFPSPRFGLIWFPLQTSLKMFKLSLVDGKVDAQRVTSLWRNCLSATTHTQILLLFSVVVHFCFFFWKSSLQTMWLNVWCLKLPWAFKVLFCNLGFRPGRSTVQISAHSSLLFLIMIWYGHYCCRDLSHTSEHSLLKVKRRQSNWVLVQKNKACSGFIFCL